MKNNSSKNLFQDRERTNILKKREQKALEYLVTVIPRWVTSNMLTGLGYLGNFITGLSFVLAKYLGIHFLYLSIIGLFINWLGDSLDGRLAYYKDKPRKWFGFTLDIITDWLGTITIGIGILIYMKDLWVLAAYGFIVFYGWSMILAIHRYKITGNYSIDSGIFGPTEVRVLIGALIVLEVLVPGSLNYTATLASVALFTFNINDTIKLLHIADLKDKEESKAKKIEIKS
ncbi:MAG: CDP-alcohol phosphatidyltransferase family protein [Paludibacteraceae bacterium]